MTHQRLFFDLFFIRWLRFRWFERINWYNYRVVMLERGWVSCSEMDGGSRADASSLGNNSRLHLWPHNWHSTGIYIPWLVFFQLINNLLHCSLFNCTKLHWTNRVSYFLADIDSSKSFSSYFMHMICRDQFFVDRDKQVAFLSDETYTISSPYAGDSDRMFRPNFTGEGSDILWEDDIVDFLRTFLKGS